MVSGWRENDVQFPGRNTTHIMKASKPMRTASLKTRIYLIRHATPDWSHTQIPYDIPPGPALIQQGEQEAAQLGGFFRLKGICKLYHSPFERARQTARISAERAGIPVQEAAEIAELRIDEADQACAARMLPFWERVVDESCRSGPIGVVSHGGPVRILLQHLGLTPEEVESYNQRFDGKNPLPPAGVWLAEQDTAGAWRVELVFVPDHE